MKDRHDSLQTIYTLFGQWSHDLEAVCDRGCSGCCTRNVTITAGEGEAILRFVMAEGISPWFAEKLAQPINHQSAQFTTNEFAKACLEGRELDLSPHLNAASCPFLVDRCCRIYPVRPFGCRFFASTTRCSSSQAALMPDYYFEAATAVAQLLEHLGQKEYWGNMLDVLPALLDIGEFYEIGNQLPQTVIIQARLRTLTARPLPGFLFSKENEERVTNLLTTLFNTRINDKRLEDILNGK